MTNEPTGFSRAGAVLMLAGLSACTPGGPASGLSSQGYEAAVIPGSRSSGDLFVGINRYSGAAVVHGFGAKNTDFSLVGEKAEPPLSEYRIVSWSEVERD